QLNLKILFERLLDLNRKHHYSYIALLEPFQSPSEIDRYMRGLGKQHAKVNCSSRILLFWDEEWEELDCIGSLGGNMRQHQNCRVYSKQYQPSSCGLYGKEEMPSSMKVTSVGKKMVEMAIEVVRQMVKTQFPRIKNMR
ncbi:hypothetical protein H5410_038598, partial [Solanum commersonii]